MEMMRERRGSGFSIEKAQENEYAYLYSLFPDSKVMILRLLLKGFQSDRK